MKTEAPKQHPLTLAWANATNGAVLSGLMTAFSELLSGIPNLDMELKAGDTIRRFGQRIAKPGGHCQIAALNYRSEWVGEWDVCNADLEFWATFRMWAGRFVEDWDLVGGGFIPKISVALHNKRMWQAYERYRATGLTKEHCALLGKLLWNVNTGRGDGISLFVQGKRPFGDSGIEYDIHRIAGWSMDWAEDEGMSAVQCERAWNLFDELAFAARDAALLASDNLQSVISKR